MFQIVDSKVKFKTNHMSSVAMSLEETDRLHHDPRQQSRCSVFLNFFLWLNHVLRSNSDIVVSSKEAPIISQALSKLNSITSRLGCQGVLCFSISEPFLYGTLQLSSVSGPPLLVCEPLEGQTINYFQKEESR